MENVSFAPLITLSSTSQRDFFATPRTCRTKQNSGYAGSSPAQGRQLAAQGFRFITFASDIGLLALGAAAGLKEVRGK